MSEPAVWFPAVRAGSGSDTFTEQLAQGLLRRGLRAEIAWLPHRAEFIPWSVQPPAAPSWANIAHVNTWLCRRFLPAHLPVVATLHLCVQDPALGPYKTLPQHIYHRAWITPIERRLLRRADRVLAVSRYAARQLAAAFGGEAPETIHNGIDTAVFTPGPDRGHPRPFRLLFAGNPSRRKGFDLLPELMRRLGPDFELRYTAGPGDSPDGLPPNMQAVPRVHGPAGMARVYRDVDALLFPTRLEGFGLVAAEAMACGLPVIASRSSALPEIIEDGVSGLLCPQDDILAFAEAVRRVAADSGFRAGLAAAARSRAVREFGLDRMVERYLGVYREVLASRLAAGSRQRNHR